MLVGMSAASALLAHQGGWDEILMVLGPILVFWLILRAARRRAEQVDGAVLADAASSEQADPATAGDTAVTDAG